MLLEQLLLLVLVLDVGAVWDAASGCKDGSMRQLPSAALTVRSTAVCAAMIPSLARRPLVAAST